MDKLKFTLRDVIYLVLIILSAVGGYYSQKARIDRLEEKIAGHSLEVIEYKLEQVHDQLKEILGALK